MITKGPWFIGDLSVSEIVDKNRKHICRIDGLKSDSTIVDVQERLSNAMLIAAAPELFDCCQELLAMVVEMLPKAGPCGWGEIAIDEAKKLIAKTKGEQ